MTIPQLLSALLDMSRTPAMATPRRHSKPQHSQLVSWSGQARTRREDELARFQLQQQTDAAIQG
ncbi:hypothetical protein [Dyella sp.]|uniref:hypothetical protein n=1 Tax=Dyella sp. TaxID=1869338 RepID=UPI002ED3DB1A